MVKLKMKKESKYTPIQVGERRKEIPTCSGKDSLAADLNLNYVGTPQNLAVEISRLFNNPKIEFKKGGGAATKLQAFRRHLSLVLRKGEKANLLAVRFRGCPATKAYC